MRRSTTAIATLLAAAWLAAPGTAAPPNVVFFLVDDLGSADCGFAGGMEIKTPRIDALAKAGTILESLYVQPVCSPTRACLMTGRYPIRTGVYSVVRPHAPWGLPLTERTLAQALKAAGYQTAICGKWHLGEFEPAYLPTARGFDRQYGHYFGNIDYFTHLRDGDHDWYRDDREHHEQGYATDLLAAEACRMIAARDPAKPLFLYVPFNGVHAPYQAPRRYLEPYAAIADEQRRTLAGMLAAVDEAVGRIVDALEQAGLREETLIIFSGDNGGCRPGSNGSLRDAKGSLYEGGIRTCGFATWRGHVPAGRRTAEPIHTVDWFPTLVTLAGGRLRADPPLDGRDIWPVITRGAKSPHDAILVATGPDRAALRIGAWKLIATGGRDELYDLATDPGERTDRAADRLDRVGALRTKLAELLADAVPSPASEPPARSPRPRRSPAATPAP
jgi:arylsulfatase A-like enzyme